MSFIAGRSSAWSGRRSWGVWLNPVDEPMADTFTPAGQRQEGTMPEVVHPRDGDSVALRPSAMSRMAVMALGAQGAGPCLAYRNACPAGGCADVGDRGEQGVPSQVAGLPPGVALRG
jgi:hypothetical protein